MRLLRLDSVVKRWIDCIKNLEFETQRDIVPSLKQRTNKNFIGMRHHLVDFGWQHY